MKIVVASAVILALALPSASDAIQICRGKRAIVLRDACRRRETAVGPVVVGPVEKPTPLQAYYRYIATSPAPSVSAGGTVTVGSLTLPNGTYLAIVRVQFSNRGSDVASVGCYLDGVANFGDVTNSTVEPNGIVTQTYAGIIENSVTLDCATTFGTVVRENVTLNAIPVDSNVHIQF